MCLSTNPCVQIIEALMSGRDSVLDTAPLLREDIMNGKPGTALLQQHSAFFMQYVAQLPRLARLVRSCCLLPTNSDLILETCMLARTIYEHLTSPMVKEYLDSVTTIVKTTHPPAYITPLSYRFKSIPASILAISYLTSQVLVCGLVQTLCALPQASHPLFLAGLNCAEAEARDTEAGLSIAMCLQYCLDACAAPPLCALWILTPIQISFGAWDRLVTRERCRTPGYGLEEEPETETIHHALRMKEWCLSVSDHIHALWKCGKTSVWLIRSTMEAFAGGPLIPQMLSRVKWEQVLKY